MPDVTITGACYSFGLGVMMEQWVPLSQDENNERDNEESNNLRLHNRRTVENFPGRRRKKLYRSEDHESGGYKWANTTGQVVQEMALPFSQPGT